MVSINIVIEQIGDKISFNVIPSNKAEHDATIIEVKAGCTFMDGIDAILSGFSEASETSYNYKAESNETLLKIKQGVIDNLNGS